MAVGLDAEALTRSGWLSHDQLEIGEDILAYDAEDGICKWTPLRHITVLDVSVPMVSASSKSFVAKCTMDHRWAVRRRGAGILIKRFDEIDTRDAIIVAAPSEGGNHPLSPREAEILGWLATDGTVGNWRRYDRPEGQMQFHASIHQSKEPHRTNIRRLLGRDAAEHIKPAGERLFSGHAAASATLEGSTFAIKSRFARSLLGKAGISEWSDLVGLVTLLDSEPRTRLFEAMLAGDGQHSNSGQVVFGKKRKPGVMAAFEILAALQGVALGVVRMSTEGDVPLRTLRKQSHTWAKCLTVSPIANHPAWFPVTDYGTWVMRWSDMITITGN